MNDDYSVNFQNIYESETLSQPVKDLAEYVLKHKYATAGDFFRMCPKDYLEDMVEDIEREHAMKEQGYFDEEMSSIGEESVLLAMMIGAAEGTIVEDLETFQAMVGRFRVLAIVTSLAKKGIVDVMYENFTLDDEYDERVIAKRKPDLDYGSLLGDEE